MADELSTKRIINLPAESGPAEGDVFVVDNESTGTKKLPITGLSDPTLTKSGQPADAKAVGDKIDALSENAYTAIEYVLKPNTYITRTGEDYHYNGWTATGHIPVVPGEKIYVYNAKTTEYCAFYKNDDTFLRRATVGVGSPFVLNVPENAYYFSYSNTTADVFTAIYRDAGIVSIFGSKKQVEEIGEWVTGNITYELEKGHIAITLNGWTYQDSTVEVRVREGSSITLTQNSVIGIHDYSTYRLFVGWRDSGGTYYRSGWLTSDFRCPMDGEYTLVITNNPAGTDISVADAEAQLFVYAYNSIIYDKYKNDSLGLWKNEWLYDIAHRGYVLGGAPADTAPAYIQAKVQGYNAIEGDIRVTSDGKYVIHHDDGMPSDNTYKISEHTLSELRTNANMGTYNGNTVQILTLRELLNIAKNIDVVVFLELKSDLTDTQIVEVMTIAKNCGMQDRVRWMAKTGNASVFRDFYPYCYLAIFNTIDYTLIQPLVISGHPERTFVYTMSTNVTDTLVENCANVNLGVVGWCVTYDWMFPDGWTDASVKAEIVRALDCGAWGMALDWWTVSKIMEETYQQYI